MKALADNILVLDNNVLIFLFDGTQSELVCQGFLRNSRAVVDLPIQMEVNDTDNLYNVRYKLNSFEEANKASEVLAKAFDVVFPWIEPGYVPYSTNSQYVIRRE